MTVTIDEARAAEVEEFEPRSIDICPNCSSGHTEERYLLWLTGTKTDVSFRCTECGARWKLASE